MPKYYLLDENKNLVEGYDKEGFLALLEEAIENGDLEHIDENSAFVSKIKSLLNGTSHGIEFVTQAQYNQLEADEELVANTYYFITDDTTLEGLEESLNSLSNSVTNIINGSQVVGKARNATNAEKTDFTNGNEYSYQVTEPADITSVEITITDVNEVKALTENHCLLWIDCPLAPVSAIGIIPPVSTLTDMPHVTPIFNLAFATGLLQFEFKQGYLEIKSYLISGSTYGIKIKFKGFTGTLLGGQTLHWKPIR